MLPLLLTLLALLHPLLAQVPTNFTIDDANPGVQYAPVEAWHASTVPCPACMQPDPAQAFDGTWHDGSVSFSAAAAAGAAVLPSSETVDDSPTPSVSPLPADSETENGGHGKGGDGDFVLPLASSDDGFPRRRHLRPPRAIQDPVTVTIQFTGQAAYVYCILPSASNPSFPFTNLSFAIDNFSLPGASFFASPESSAPFVYKVPVLALRGLEEAPHTLVISSETGSAFLFDYLVYTAISNATSSAAAALASESSNPGDTPAENIHNTVTFAAAVGGSVGVLFVLSFGLCLSIYLRRRRSRLRALGIHRSSSRSPSPYDENPSNVLATSSSRRGTQRRRRGGSPVDEEMAGPRPFVPRYFPGTVLPPPTSPTSPSLSSPSSPNSGFGSPIGTPPPATSLLLPPPAVSHEAVGVGAGGGVYVFGDQHTQHPDITLEFRPGTTSTFGVQSEGVTTPDTMGSMLMFGGAPPPPFSRVESPPPPFSETPGTSGGRSRSGTRDGRSRPGTSGGRLSGEGRRPRTTSLGAVGRTSLDGRRNRTGSGPSLIPPGLPTHTGRVSPIPPLPTHSAAAESGLGLSGTRDSTGTLGSEGWLVGAYYRAEAEAEAADAKLDLPPDTPDLANFTPTPTATPLPPIDDTDADSNNDGRPPSRRGFYRVVWTPADDEESVPPVPVTPFGLTPRLDSPMVFARVRGNVEPPPSSTRTETEGAPQVPSGARPDTATTTLSTEEGSVDGPVSATIPTFPIRKEGRRMTDV